MGPLQFMRSPWGDPYQHMLSSGAYLNLPPWAQTLSFRVDTSPVGVDSVALGLVLPYYMATNWANDPDGILMSGYIITATYCMCGRVILRRCHKLRVVNFVCLLTSRLWFIVVFVHSINWSISNWLLQWAPHLTWLKWWPSPFHMLTERNHRLPTMHTLTKHCVVNLNKFYRMYFKLTSIIALPFCTLMVKCHHTLVSKYFARNMVWKRKCNTLLNKKRHFNCAQSETNGYVFSVIFILFWGLELFCYKVVWSIKYFKSMLFYYYTVVVIDMM